VEAILSTLVNLPMPPAWGWQDSGAAGDADRIATLVDLARSAEGRGHRDRGQRR
jgi:hypothetical protein